jgi:hypothetical protein
MIIKKPILIGNRTIILLSVYEYKREKDEGVFPIDVWLEDEVLDVSDEDRMSRITQSAEEGAKEFITQLRGKWTPRFLRALGEEIKKELEKVA